VAETIFRPFLAPPGNAAAAIRAAGGGGLGWPDGRSCSCVPCLRRLSVLAAIRRAWLGRRGLALR